MLNSRQLWPITPFGATTPPGYWPQPNFTGATGIATEGDALVSVTADGVDLNLLWNEVLSTISEWNSHRSAIQNLLSYGTTNVADAIPQSIFGDEGFDVATEFGEPTSIRTPTNHALLGYTLLDFDKATRFTWKALRRMTAEQVRASTNYALEADNKLTSGLVMTRLFNPELEVNEWNYNCVGLWSGDGMVPPPWLGNTFDGTHNHYLVSGAEEIDSGDLDMSITHLQEHGYGLPDDGSQLMAFVNPAQYNAISKFRAGQVNNNEAIAAHDFIPASNAPAYILPQANIIGQIAPGDAWGLRIQGSYGPLWICESYFIPANYFAVVCTRGPNSPLNPIGFRSHVIPAYQGLRVIPGRDQRYPLVESFFQRSCGVGARHRGAGVVTQIKASGGYDAPMIPTTSGY
jgi:hypothetical protein